LKAARGRQPKASDFANDPSEPAMPHTLFDGRQDFGLPARLGIDDAIGMKADGGKRRGEEVTALQAPQNWTLQAREDAGGEQSSACTMLARSAGFHELVNSPEGEPIPRQVLVEGGNTERQHGTLPAASLEAPDALAKLRQNDIAPGIVHALPQGRLLCNVPVLF
jgi:hypothetical protein